ncbi:hypothetical protein RJ639_010452 [Escallonia herrerae]|uniref:Cytochrome P450 n=1 Tax=Escallonia herrerae TaxID=1293975 RepID=A0AA88VQY3_9ASTE|nr:hypothetical protein RJ639_010452 [Escallonia herrerae]
MPAGAEWRIIRRALNTHLTHPQKLDTLRGLRHKAVEELIQHVKEASQREEAVDIGELAFATIRGFRKAKSAYSWLDAVSDDFISRRLKHRQSKLPRDGDFLDSLLDFSQENEAEFNCKHIKILLVDLFLAGTETSSNTTEWAMTELLLNPSIMANLRQEVSDSVGSKGKIEESEILELPYLQAVVKETMRLHLSVPFLVPHKTETSVKLKGYEVPPNTQILVNAWAIARDTENWENPMHFLPERFLKSEADFKGQHFSFLPFGSGRRMCPGIPLAQRVVSLMIASLVYHFDWKLPHSTSELDMNDIFGITLLRATPLLAVPMNFREGIRGQTE